MPEKLPPFPVDDFTLDQMEHALGGAFEVDPETGDHRVVGADFSFGQLLDFLSGYDPAKTVIIEEANPLLPGIEGAEVGEYPDPLYSMHDVIEALIREIKRLRHRDEWLVRWHEGRQRRSKRYNNEQGAREFAEAMKTEEWATGIELMRRDVSGWELVND